jgi:mRNA interferase HigB
MNRKELDYFKRKHPQSNKPLIGWETLISQSTYQGLHDLKKTFRSADYLAAGYTVFNIGGNKYRLITQIDYSNNIVEIKIIWTHAEYSHPKNAEDLRRGRI